MAYTDYTIKGVKLASGNQAYGSKEMAVWLPLFLLYMKVVHGIELVIVKVRDKEATANSATTHLGGWAVDFRTWNLSAADRKLVIREATRFGMILHYRVPSQGFEYHLHGMLDVGYWTPCSYQIDATKDGRDGLGYLGRKGVDLDKASRPPQSEWLGYSKGVAAMNAALNKASTPKENYMALTQADAKLVAKEVWNSIVTSGGEKTTALALAQSRNFDEAQSVALGQIATSLSRLSDKVGASATDEKAIVAGVVAGLNGMIHDSVVKSIEAALKDINRAEADGIAEAVVAELSARLAS